MLLLFSSINEQFSLMVEQSLSENCLFRFNLDANSIKESVVSIFENDIVIEQRGNRVRQSQISGVWIKRQSLLISSAEELDYCGFCDYRNFKLWKDEWNSIIKQLIEHLAFLGIPFFDEAGSIIRAEKKILQLDLAREIGFNTPDTIFSNSKTAIVDFLRRHDGEGILKLSTQPVFSENNQIYFIYTNKVSLADFSEMDDTTNSPVIIQNYIEKQYEVRYTFVNGEHFVCKIESQMSEKSKVDCRRYDFANTPYTAILPPAIIKDKVTPIDEQT